MLCKRCPHLVRHGQMAADQKTIEFRNMCGLLMRAERGDEPDASKAPKRGPKKQPTTTVKKPISADKSCTHFPFPSVFDYMECPTYIETFKAAGRKNDVVPTKDFQFSEALSGSSITDMELL